jgi:hypothetical protein
LKFSLAPPHFRRLLSRAEIRCRRAGVNSQTPRATNRLVLGIVIALAVLVAAAGCSDHSASTIAAYNNANIKRLTNLYSAYQAAHSFQGPPDEASLKAFVKEQAPWRLELMQIDVNKVDDLFISERDHKPFKVKYGVTSGPGAINALVFEQDGVSGQRQVGVNGGTVEEADAEKYKQMWEGRYHPKVSASPAQSLELQSAAQRKS